MAHLTQMNLFLLWYLPQKKANLITRIWSDELAQKNKDNGEHVTSNEQNQPTCDGMKRQSLKENIWFTNLIAKPRSNLSTKFSSQTNYDIAAESRTKTGDLTYHHQKLGFLAEIAKRNEKRLLSKNKSRRVKRNQAEIELITSKTKTEMARDNFEQGSEREYALFLA